MSHELTVVDFDASRLAAVAGFHCGSEPWALAAASWIAAPLEFPGALLSMRDRGTTVWLFYLGESLVGFASLGTTKWNQQEIAYIPQLAIGVNYQGEPADAPRNERFAYQIISHVLAESLDRGFRTVGLRVDAENTRAVRFYENVGFIALPGREQRHGREFIRMIATL
jgi:hypothetical protein